VRRGKFIDKPEENVRQVRTLHARIIDNGAIRAWTARSFSVNRGLHAILLMKGSRHAIYIDVGREQQRQKFLCHYFLLVYSFENRKYFITLPLPCGVLLWYYVCIGRVNIARVAECREIDSDEVFRDGMSPENETVKAYGAILRPLLH
jgi:hypothetical protein